MLHRNSFENSQANAPHKRITAALHKFFQSTIGSSAESKFRWAESLLIVMAALNQLAWKTPSNGNVVTTVAIPLGLLFVLFVLNSLPVAVTHSRRMVQIFSELVLITIASFLGPHRIYGRLFLILIGKAALILNRCDLIVVISIVIVHYVVFVAKLRVCPVHTVPLFPWLLDRHSITLLEYFVNFTTAVLVVLFISILLKSEQESRHRSEQMKLELDSMATILERERIARDIHDSLGHALTGVNIQLQLAQRLQDSDVKRSREAIALARGFAIRAVSDVRRAVRVVRDSYFDFSGAIKELVDATESSGDCKVTANLDIDRQSWSSQLSHSLYFLIQEAVTNAQRHAHAGSISVNLACKDQILLCVQDNGVGFCKEDITPGFGIKGMEERVASLGGTISISSAPGEGTEISITLPTQAGDLDEDGNNDRNSRC